MGALGIGKTWEPEAGGGGPGVGPSLGKMCLSHLQGGRQPSQRRWGSLGLSLNDRGLWEVC